MPSAHSVHFVARTEHPLAGRSNISVADVLAWPFVSPSRIPPRILDPMLAAHRASAAEAKNALPFPSIQCNGLAPVKRILATSDAISASILSCVATELETGQLILLGTAPWLHLHYGIVSLKGGPWTQLAEKFREYVLQAERQAAAEEERLLERFRPGARRTSSRARKAARGGGPTDAHGDD